MSDQSFPYDVFLSHNNAQKDWTRELARRLRDDGFKVWFDEWVLPRFAGADWIQLLREGVKESRKVVLIWSEEFFAKEWPLFESRMIQLLDPIGRQQRVIPLLHSPCKVPEDWGFRESLDFTGCLDNNDEFEFRYHHLVHNLDNLRPFEGDFQRFRERGKHRSAEARGAGAEPPETGVPWGAPPGRLLGTGDFSVAQVDSKQIVHGVRPAPQDLREGCFMDRPGLLEETLKIIRDKTSALEALPGRNPIVFFWITGPSGAGKSVLVLQLMRQLVINREVEAVNYLGELAHILPRSLTYWNGSSERPFIVVDDLFAPENREWHLWNQVAEVAFTSNWRRIPWILTCGPPEHLKAFRQQAHRHPEFHLVEIRIDPMSPQERSAYHRWYERRTDTQIPLINEPILIAAAWAYELRRQANLSPEEFAHRFYNRLGELGLQQPARAAMALNQYGLKAPAGLFAGHETELNQLMEEQTYRLIRSGDRLRHGRFFHTQISKIIYQVIVPEAAIHSRGQDLANGLAVTLDDTATAGTFSEWLDSPRTQSLISPLLKIEILQAMWPAFLKRGLAEDIVPRLQQWHAMSHASGANLSAIGATRQISEWFHKTAENAPIWGLLFQMVWRDAEPGQREMLYAQAKVCLERQFEEAGYWSWVWQLLWAHRPGDRELIDIAYVWLYEHPGHKAWRYLWKPIFDNGSREPDLLRTALNALPLQPSSSADVQIWQDIEILQPDTGEFIGLIVRKLIQIRIPRFLEKGIRFIHKQMREMPKYEIACSAIEKTISEPTWAYLWLTLVEGGSSSDRILSFGREWLAGHEDKPEWNYVWQRLVEVGFERDQVLELGREWLAGREDKPEWAHVWRKLVEVGFERDQVLELGREWLAGREDKPEWSHVWRKLVEVGFERDQVLELGREWLAGREDKPEWAHVWQRLVEVGFERDQVLELGREWLAGREDKPEWAHVWQRLVEVGFERDQVLELGREWLAGREDKPEWNYVWQRLVEVGFERDQVLELGREWLAGREDKPEWSHVWQRLVEVGFERDQVLELGREWLAGREDLNEYPYVYRIIHGHSPSLKSGVLADELAKALGLKVR